MLSLGFIGFLSPWCLLALMILPVLWQIVRFTPPSPRRIEFPAIKLLKFLKQKEETPRRAPWWLLALRIGLIVLIIIGAAHPILNPEQQLATRNSIILAIDNGWNSAKNWASVSQQAGQIIDVAMRENKTVQIITTAPNPDSTFDFVSDYLTPAEAAQIIKGLRPLPWPARYDLAAKEFSEKKLVPNPDIFWFSDGLKDDGFYDLLNGLSSKGQLFFILRQDQHNLLLSADASQAGGIDLVVRRTLPLNRPMPPASVTVQAFSQDGKALGQIAATFESGKTVAKSKLELPLDVKNKVSRLIVSEQINAGTTYLIDETGRQHPLGIVTTQAMDSSKPLLDDLYFIERAAAPFAEVFHGNIDELLKSNIAVMILTDANNPNKLENDELRRWVEKGGTLIRFAGDNLVKTPDSLLPVPVHDKPRSMTGNLSWSEPIGLAAMPDNGPFYGLTVPPDIKINRQLLTTPTPDLAQKTWAALQDGTPLVTGTKLGNGQVILFHIAANHQWSNLILSGLFVEMLQRLIWSSQGVIAANAQEGFSLYEMLNGFGQLQTPPTYVKNATYEDLQTHRAGPYYPPGYYGSETDKKAFNLSDHVAAMDPIVDLPNGIKIMDDLKSREKDIRPFLYLAALLLALADMIISLNLASFIPTLRRSMPAAMIAIGILMTAPSAAASPDNIQAAKHPRLGYIKTYNADIDRISAAGLTGLTHVLRTRTSVEAADPKGVDIENDDLAFYPILYWPMPDHATPLSQAASMRINSYIRNGGMIIIDTRDGDGSSISENLLADYFQNIDVPVLNPIRPEHVLLRSFYLLKEWPGRWSDKTLWISDHDSNNFDGVASIIIGTQDWAAAWAVDKSGKPLYPAVPGGEKQRETARRFGINLVMYALTGNYKSDQVHVPAILERLGHE